MRLPRPSAAINITPLVDVLLVLVVALLLAAAFSTRPLPVDLPATGLQGQLQARAAVMVALDVRGTLLLRGQALDDEQLHAALREGNGVVELGPDAGVSYEQLSQAVARLQHGGAREVRLLTR